MDPTEPVPLPQREVTEEAELSSRNKFRVYRGTLENGMHVVVKECINQTPREIDTLTKEASAAAKLEHPNIVRVIGMYNVENRPSYIMKDIPGISLEELLKKEPLTEEEKERYIRQLSSATDYANSRGIIHRDIKPDNPLISGFEDHDPKAPVEDRNLLMTDFGSASGVYEPEKGKMIGTLAYVMPEQMTGKDSTITSEEYAVALVAYTVLTNGITARSYFNDGNSDMKQLMIRYLSCEGLHPRARDFISRRYGENTAEVFDKALSKKSVNRYESATEFSDKLFEAIQIDKENKMQG